MDDLNRKKSSSTSIIAIIILALVLGFGAYTYTKQKQNTAPPTTTETATKATETTTTPPSDTAAAPPAATAPVVVATKKLDIPTPAAPPPSASNKDPKIVAMMGARTLGNAAAPVKVTEYASLTCPHCGAFHRESFDKFKTQFIDTGKVQMTFKEFPLNQPAMDASQILRCMPEDKYVSFMNLLFQEQEKWAYDPKYKDFLKQNAKLAGMSDATFDSCLANTALKEAILGDMKAAGDQFKVQSTPSFVFEPGGKVLVGNQPIEEFAKSVEEASSAPAIAATSAPAPAMTEPAAAPEQKTETTMEPAPAAAADAAVKSSGSAAPEKTDSTDEETPPAE